MLHQKTVYCSSFTTFHDFRRCRLGALSVLIIIDILSSRDLRALTWFLSFARCLFWILYLLRSSSISTALISCFRSSRAYLIEAWNEGQTNGVLQFIVSDCIVQWRALHSTFFKIERLIVTTEVTLDRRCTSLLVDCFILIFWSFFLRLSEQVSNILALRASKYNFFAFGGLILICMS